VEISTKVALTLNEIVTKARQVDELAAEVAGASHEQTQGITQINSAIGQMDKVTQSNAANAEESAAAAQELNAQAEVMKESVAELLQLVGGHGREAGFPQPRETETQFSQNPETPIRRKARAHAPATRPAAANGNGHAQDVSPAARSKEIPLDDSFKNF
jgi:uncharacterized phage infection (PIP) family protein YhgE